MITKHFFKVLFIFLLMIAVGMAGVVLLSILENPFSEAEVPAEEVVAEDIP